jgi:hypothetical protein
MDFHILPAMVSISVFLVFITPVYADPLELTAYNKTSLTEYISEKSKDNL